MTAITAPIRDESAFDRWRRKVGTWLGPAAFLVVWAVPIPLSVPAHRLAAVMAWVMVYWISEALPLPVTALLGPALAIVLGVAKARDALAPFADPVIFLFLGSFLLAEALRVHGLDRRIALGILSLPGAASSAMRVRAAIAIVTALISMWVSNTATAAMMLPIALGLVKALREAGVRDNPRGTLLMVGIAASLGGIATPVGTPPNMIALGFLAQQGRKIDFLHFMAVGVPLALALTAVALVVAGRLEPVPDGGAVPNAAIVRQRAELPRFGSGQRACATAFGVAIALWLLPGVVVVFHVPPESLLARAAASLDESVVAILAALILFFWPVEDRRALEWSDALRIDWGTLLLFGGGLSLGKMMFDSGLAPTLGRAAIEFTGVHTLWGLTALVLATTILLTEITSNTATVSMLAPLTLALAHDLGVSLTPPLLAVAFGASMGFMFPVGTPPNAIVYGTGLVPMTTMMRTGILIDILSFFVIFATLRMLCPLMGLA